MTDKRFIEEHFPVREVSKESSREKFIRHGHISTLHIWWARRPLAASRAIAYAALIPAPKINKDVKSINQEIFHLSRWENPLNSDTVSRAKDRILEYYGRRPRVLDPFSGGGSIPLEALRLGCETYAADYNPVSNLILKATLEHPFHKSAKIATGKELKRHVDSPLITKVKKWSQWILDEARKDLAQFFPNEDGCEPIGYLWSRCIPCQNPKCGATIPLLKQFWLAKTKNKRIALLPMCRDKKITFSIIDNEDEKFPTNFEPKNGTTSRGKATCLICGNRMEAKRVKELFSQGKNDEAMNVAIVKNRKKPGKTYQIADQNNRTAFTNAQYALRKKIKCFRQKYGIDPIPNEPTPDGKGSGAERAFSLRLYNMNTWGDLFNDRQKLVLLTFMEKILSAAEMMDENKTKNNTQVLSYLAIMLDRLVDKNATLCTWNVSREEIEHVFGRQALPIVWDYAEVNPFTSVGWPNMEGWVLRVLVHLAHIDAEPAIVKHASATNLPFPDEFFDAVITDPPYYDNVPYSHLSDFFYVWLKRVMGGKLPDLFSTPLTPKSDEIVMYSNGPGGKEGGKKVFADMLEMSFTEMRRVLKTEGISVIVYAHKSTEGWETMIESLLRAGLVVTAAWPIHTEMRTRLRSKQSAVLRSSIYMVCRKQKRESVGFYRNVKRDLKRHLDAKLDQLWDEGISGADFFIAAIGSAIEVYGRYDNVMNDKDESVSVRDLLADTRVMVTNYAIDKVIHGEFTDSISVMTRFYILWRWAHGEARAPYDEALKLAQSVGVDLSQSPSTGFIHKNKEYVHVLGPAERSERDNLEESDEIIDTLHHVLRLWRAQKMNKVNDILSERGYVNSEILRRVAQAISESLHGVKDSTEKDWIDGMFTGFASRRYTQQKMAK